MARTATLALALLALADPAPRGGRCFTITVVDETTGRGVPLVELKTVHGVRYYTDSAGVVAFYEPGLMDQSVYFHVSAHGYELEKDGFGYRGRALAITEGGEATIRVRRRNIAERLYRVTGAGIYSDSVLAGRPVPVEHPVLNGLVFGSDSVVSTIYRGRIYWFWGDTNRPSYPLGNFNVSGATSALPTDGGLHPIVGVNFTYFVGDKGFAKAMAPVPGPGPTWIDGLVTLRDETGAEKMFAAYAKVRQNMETYERGLVEYDDDKRQFEKIVQFDLHAPMHPGGHSFKHTVDGVEYVYFAHPYPVVRVRADREHLIDLSTYEAFTCLKEGSRLDDIQFDRAAGGQLRYDWKKNTPPMSFATQAKLIEAGQLKPGEALFHVQDPDTGNRARPHNGSVYWNRYRGRWVMIFGEIFGTSVLGEIWYAEADTPLGPWVYARKIVTHDTYSFYNPKQHPMFDKQNGQMIFFEGTYTRTFSGNADATPRYDYNQIMYRLDLADRRLALPVAVYDVSPEDVPCRFTTVPHLRHRPPDRPIAFFAPDQPGTGTIPVYVRETGDGGMVLTVEPQDSRADRPAAAPLFYAVAADTKEPPATTVPLYQFASDKPPNRAYSIDESWSKPGYRRSDQPLCRVWRNPLAVRMPP
ncbi:MAG: hypothetical protein JSV19_11660 [Phycisphaerales bacterium]|nr:MAG: hypothetical protein JSV19_11660 [Phycisphaerales bacterium]